MNGYLPRLLYVGDVPIEASYHGSLLLYRLLQNYPAESLVIVEAGVEVSRPDRQLPNAEYHPLAMPLSRLQTTRFAPLYSAACERTAILRAGRLESRARASRPEAILTVTHGASWITAFELARRLCIPLHLICHDVWAGPGQGWKHRIFDRIYRAATSRLCVSPFMMRKYAAIYGAEGSVLYPSRAAGAARYAGAPERLRTISGPFTCVFAGTINVPGMVTALQRLARALATIGGRLLIYGPLTPSDARTNGLALANIELGGLIPSEHLMDLLRERADALFAPMSFDPADRDRMEIGFPSKLTDYTSVGLPLLIYGPPYCSAVQWSGQNLGAAEVVSEEDSGALASAVSRLAHDAEYRMSLAKNALIAGDSYFSHDAAVGVFHKALLGDTLNEAYGASGRCYFSPEKKMAE